MVWDLSRSWKCNECKVKMIFGTLLLLFDILGFKYIYFLIFAMILLLRLYLVHLKFFDLNLFGLI